MNLKGNLEKRRKNQWYHFGVAEFTTHFRTCFGGWIGMFTGDLKKAQAQDTGSFLAFPIRALHIGQHRFLVEEPRLLLEPAAGGEDPGRVFVFAAVSYISARDSAWLLLTPPAKSLTFEGLVENPLISQKAKKSKDPAQ